MKKNLELLPKGKFVLNGTDDSGNETRYTGRFSMYAIDVFLRARGIDNYLELIDRIGTGMSTGEYADLIAAGLNDYHRDEPKYTRAQAMDVIDECFENIIGEDFKNLIFHGLGKVANLGISTDEDSRDAEKKSD